MNWRYFLLITGFLFMQNVFSQNKYALLIGINKYQKKDEKGKIVIDPANTLGGCVNDAESIKELLIKKFGFKTGNITTLYDFKATKKNIIDAINNLLLFKCNPGDIVVFYYAGHGSTFRYGENAAQTAEYILPTDVFSNYRFLSASQQDNSFEYSFIQTSLLASLFNKFVEKKVTLTAIFDCCHSNGTIGIKKTVNTKTIINGVPKVLTRTFWQSLTEMTKEEKFIKRTGLIEYPAWDLIQKNICNIDDKQTAIKSWLSANGYAKTRDLSKCTVTWTNNFKQENWMKTCGKTGSVKVLFTVKDNCGHSDTTSATFTTTDNERPKIEVPAKDITIAFNADKDAALSMWLSAHGGAIASDACSDSLTWTNDFDNKLKASLDTSGSVLVAFKVTDACGNSEFSRATFTIDDEYNPVEYRLTIQESAAIIELLNNLKDIRKNSIRFNYLIKGEELKVLILQQLDIMDSIEKKVSAKTGYLQTGNLDALQGTLLMSVLVKNTDYLMNLLSQIPYREEDMFFDNMILNVSADSLKEKGSGVSRNAANSKLVLPNGYPYKEFEFRPPSQIPGSKFLFMSATDDVQESKEDFHNGVKHGLFTAALMDVFEKSTPDMKVTEVFEKIKQLLKERKAPQTPTLRAAEIRKNQNLIGK